jgi:hypothetical protein
MDGVVQIENGRDGGLSFWWASRLIMNMYEAVWIVLVVNSVVHPNCVCSILKNCSVKHERRVKTKI